MDVRNIALHPKTFQRTFLRHMTSLTLNDIKKTEVLPNKFGVTSSNKFSEVKNYAQIDFD